MLQHAKFDSTLVPISRSVLPPSAQPDVSFDWFFTHILAHELSHGIGSHEIKAEGKRTSVRQQLKEIYSTIEGHRASPQFVRLHLSQYSQLSVRLVTLL